MALEQSSQVRDSYGDRYDESMSDGSGSTILDFATVVERDSEGERTPAEQLDNIGEQCP